MDATGPEAKLMSRGLPDMGKNTHSSRTAVLEEPPFLKNEPFQGSSKTLLLEELEFATQPSSKVQLDDSIEKLAPAQYCTIGS